jgi:hypothetical protein
MTYKSLIYTKEEIFVSHTIQKPKNINGAKYVPFFYIFGRKDWNGCALVVPALIRTPFLQNVLQSNLVIRKG